MPHRISDMTNVVRPRRLGATNVVRPRRLGATNVVRPRRPRVMPRTNLGTVPFADESLGYLRRNDGGISKKTRVF
jgi:hypothetical protein